MRYCASCILPDTRPGLTIGADGICSACRSHGAEAPLVDWEERAKRFAALADEVRALGRDWDCVIPVSGGKDSTWQVVTCLGHGLRPLAVTWRTPGRTDLGQRNLDNLISLGVDHIDFSVNPEVERRFVLKTLEKVGSPAVPMHLAIFNIPTTVASRFDIPLVVWGENSAYEYVGEGDHVASFELTPEWIREHGAVYGTTADDWANGDLSARDLAAYRAPEVEGVRAVFLGMFFEWDPQRTYDVAAAHGFEASDAPLTGTYDYADVDDEFISIHHWLKWHKFGFTRVWDNLSLEIRNGRLTRDEAIDTVRELGDQTPLDDISSFCRFTRIEEERFFGIAERFRNTDIWTRRDGVWQIDDFLIPDYPWA